MISKSIYYKKYILIYRLYILITLSIIYVITCKYIKGDIFVDKLDFLIAVLIIQIIIFVNKHNTHLWNMEIKKTVYYGGKNIEITTRNNNNNILAIDISKNKLSYIIKNNVDIMDILLNEIPMTYIGNFDSYPVYNINNNYIYFKIQEINKIARPFLDYETHYCFLNIIYPRKNILLLKLNKKVFLPIELYNYIYNNFIE